MTTTTLSPHGAATTWQIDPAHTQVGFEVSHMMFAKVRGRFERLSGAIAVGAGDDRDIDRVEATLEAESIDTGQPQRDEHLRSPDFFDVERFPELRFAMSDVGERSGDSFRLHGTLTIRDVSRTVTLEVTETGRGTDPWGQERLGFRATTTLDRRDFGLTWNQALETGGILVGNDVRITIEGQAVRQDD